MTTTPGRTRLALAAVLGAAALGAPLPAAAGCAGPVLDGVGAATPGERLVVVGHWFSDGCDDTGQGTAPGCAGPPPRPSEVVPQRGVVLVLEQGGRTWQLGTDDADARADTRWEVVLPSDVQPGSAVLRAGFAQVPLTVR